MAGNKFTDLGSTGFELRFKFGLIPFINLHGFLSMYAWFDQLRVCLICHSYNPPTDIMCEPCWKRFYELSESKNKIDSANYPFSVKRLWVWNDLSAVYVKKIIYNLKKGHSEKVYSRLSQLFLSQINLEPYVGQQIVFIPAPALEAKFNHALYWAKSLAKMTGCLCIDVLEERISKQKQKSLGVRERAKRKMSLSSSFRSGPRRQFVFVDDIITTGATAKAAYRTLLQPQNFEVWVLAERTKRNYSLYD